MVNINVKGKQGEREAIKFLQPIVSSIYEQLNLEAPTLERNLVQTRCGGYDIIGLDWMALEIKRHETLNISSYWNQVTAAAKEGQEPVVMFRQNRKQWRFVVRGWMHTGGDGHFPCRCEITKDDFVKWITARIVYHLDKEV